MSATTNTEIGSLRSLAELQDSGEFIQSETELTEIASALGLDLFVSGAVVNTRDGEYSRVWVTGSSRPFELSTTYERVL